MRLVRVLVGVALAAAAASPAYAADKPKPADKVKGKDGKPGKGDKSKDKPKGGLHYEVRNGRRVLVVDLVEDPRVAKLVGGDVDAAAEAAASLEDGSDDFHEELLDALATGLAPKVAVPALAGVAKHPDDDDVAILIVYAGHRDEDVRAAAIAALAAYPDSAARKAIVAALGDDVQRVRSAAALAVAKAKLRDGLDRLLALLDKGDEAAPPALALLADADLAHTIAEHLGTAPPGALAATLGAILKRADFPEPAKLEVVRALAKMPGAEATAALTDYVEATNEKPPKKSRAEAEKIVEARLSGGGAQ